MTHLSWSFFKIEENPEAPNTAVTPLTIGGWFKKEAISFFHFKVKKKSKFDALVKCTHMGVYPEGCCRFLGCPAS